MRGGGPRLWLAATAALVTAAGLASRSGSIPLPDFVETYAGDTLWAVLVFLVLAFAFPTRRVAILAGVAFAISLSVELLQLYQAPWLNEIRGTLPGRLLLGQGFLFSDLLCYALGIAVASIVYCIATRSGAKEIGIIAAGTLITCLAINAAARWASEDVRPNSRGAADSHHDQVAVGLG